ncbi:MAG: tRNA pseudouridine(13) synthase TruD [Phycisphaeraceae bacterium]
MKIKCQPEDFRVEELTDLPLKGGSQAIYRLTKRSLGTPEAVDAIANRWKLRRETFSFGGMKDRHALTSQHITIHNGPKRNLKQTNIELEYLGQVAEPFGPHHISANRFTLVVRDLAEATSAKAMTAIEEVRTHGFPNYFDDQRFGSVGESGAFVARAWCLGDVERALWLAIAEPNQHDRPAGKEHKRILREGWGKWKELAAAMEGFEHRRIVLKLVERPEDFRSAMAALPAPQRDTLLSAFQSHLWNRMLARLIRQHCNEGSRFDVKLGPDAVPLFRTLTVEAKAAMAELQLPFPSARERPELEPVKTLYHETLAELELKAEQLKVKWPRDVFFKKGARPALVMPAGLSAVSNDDELYEGRRKVTLAFDLPRGAYATILVKRVFG